MYGLDAIGEANGWAMAILGAFIVFCGLVALSIAISQLHRILDMFDKSGGFLRRRYNGKGGKVELEKTGPADSGEAVCPHPFVCPDDVHEIAGIWKPLVNRIGSPFYLADLHELARKNNFPHPHLTITRLRDANILVPIGEGLFEWNANAIEEERS